VKQHVVAVLGLIAVGCNGPSMEDAGSDASSPLDAPIDGADAVSAEGADAGLDAASAVMADAGVDASARTFEAILTEIQSCDPARFDAAMHDVAWSEGWPLEGSGRWLFATRLDDAPPTASLVGDLGGWDTARWPATRCGDGTRFFVVVAEGELSAPAIGSKYKWYVARDDSYRAPDEATQYGYDGFGRFGWVRASRDVAHLEQFPAFRSRHLEPPRTFRAYLPAGFEPQSSAARTMRTLLLHDGQNVFHPDAFFGGWRVDAALAARGSDVVAVAIDNASDRMDAYTQVPDDIGGGALGGRADDYLALLEEEALPFFRARYGIVAEGRSLMVAGSSLGGLVTLVAVERELASMGCGAALSSAVGWGSIDGAAPRGRALVQTWAGHHGPLYLDSGGEVSGSCVDADGDGVEDDADDSDNYCVNVQMVRALSAGGYVRDVDLVYAWEPGAPHNEAAWAARIGAALDACEAMGWRAP
jgi:predicted alpha/beta superfamily hydrolase